MINFFIVHSAVTNAMARHIIQTEQIPHESVRFLHSRNFVMPDNQFEVIKMPYTHNPVDSFAIQLAFWKTWPKLKEFDNWLSTITNNQPFYWYADHSYNTQFYLAVTHPLCQGYYFMEEGVVVYNKEEKWHINKRSNPFRNLLYWLNFGKRNNPNRHYFDMNAGNYLGCYGIAKESFGKMPHKKIIGLPFPVRTFEEQYPCLLIHDAIYDYYEPKIYLKWVQCMTENALEQGFDRICQKFHPGQKPETIKIILKEMEQLVGDRATLCTLDNSVSLEEIAISQKPTIYVVTSSVGIYAYIAGARVISLLKIFCNDLPELEKSFEGLFPDFYADNIEYLEV